MQAVAAFYNFYRPSQETRRIADISASSQAGRRGISVGYPAKNFRKNTVDLGMIRFAENP